jgi:hypothetical protein
LELLKVRAKGSADGFCVERGEREVKNNSKVWAGTTE